MQVISRADRASDAALLAGLAVGDQRAATIFVRRFQSAVFGLAVSITRDAAIAEDVAQDVFLRAWRAAGSYDSRRGSVLTWLLTITRNAAIDVVRAGRSTPVGSDVLEQLINDTLRGPDSAESALSRLATDQAVRRLQELPPEQARAVVLAVIGGYTAADVGQEEEIPLGTAKTRIRTGLRRLRAGMEQEQHD